MQFNKSKSERKKKIVNSVEKHFSLGKHVIETKQMPFFNLRKPLLQYIKDKSLFKTFLFTQLKANLQPAKTYLQSHIYES